jgi:hypothetical protein
MRHEYRHHCITLVAIALAGISSQALAAPKIDCEAVTKATRDELLLRDPNDVHGEGGCMKRGWDPQIAIRPKEGKGSGARVDGSGGISYNAVTAPENPPGRQGANASVSRNAITSSCNFPPRIKIGVPPSVSIPKGSCLNFLNDVFKDKNGQLNSSPPPTGVDASDACPAESDTTGAYGVKASIASGGSVAAPCGGVVPTSATEMTLNANPTHLAFTSGNFLWAYRKSGSSFSPILSGVKLPSYFCEKNTKNPNKGLTQNSVDLTPATDQIIAYNPGDGFLSIRLSSRATMDAGFNPPYDPSKPEKYLVIPLNAAGVPQVPKNCDKESTYYRDPVGGRDIQIIASNELGCDATSFSATRYNNGSCGILGCNNDWVWRCQPELTNYRTASPPLCPQAGGIPPASCPPSPPTTDANCDIITIKPSGAACADKTQYGVLNRPGLYYPSGVTANFYTVSGRSTVMAETTADTKFFTQSNTTIYIAPSAPTITLEEGGTIIFKDKSMLLMNPKAIINARGTSVTLKGGGQLLTAGGNQLQAFVNDAIYAIPPAMGNPLEVRVGRSITLPAGYLIPSTAAVGGQPPYMRLPVDPPPP